MAARHRRGAEDRARRRMAPRSAPSICCSIELKAAIRRCGPNCHSTSRYASCASRRRNAGSSTSSSIAAYQASVDSASTPVSPSSDRTPHRSGGRRDGAHLDQRGLEIFELAFRLAEGLPTSSGARLMSKRASLVRQILQARPCRATRSAHPAPPCREIRRRPRSASGVPDRGKHEPALRPLAQNAPDRIGGDLEVRLMGTRAGRVAQPNQSVGVASATPNGKARRPQHRRIKPIGQDEGNRIEFPHLTGPIPPSCRCRRPHARPLPACPETSRPPTPRRGRASDAIYDRRCGQFGPEHIIINVEQDLGPRGTRPAEDLCHHV